MYKNRQCFANPDSRHKHEQILPSYSPQQEESRHRTDVGLSNPRTQGTEMVCDVIPDVTESANRAISPLKRSSEGVGL